MRHHTALRWLGVPLLAAMLTACGPAAAPAPPAPAQSPAAPAAPAPAAAAARPAGNAQRLTFATTVEVKSLDPHQTSDSNTKSVLFMLFDKLVTMDEQMRIQPQLATEWSAGADGLTWTFKLRQGVKFHDGTPFNAEAVKFTFDRFLDPANAFTRRSILAMVAGVRVVDPNTVEIKTSAPFGPFLAHLANPSSEIISPAAVQKHGKDFGINPVGTGPYRLKEWRTGTHIILERNPDFWGPAPAIDEIVYRPVPEDSTRAVGLETGEIDVAFSVAPQDAVRLKDNPKLTVVQAPSTRIMYLSLNNAKKPFDDKRVRQAVNYAINKDALIRSIMLGYGTKADSPLPPTIWPHTKVGSYDHDVAKAKALLAEAGYPNGFKTTLWTPVGRYLNDRQLAEAIVGQLAAVGIQAELVPMEFAALTDRMVKAPDQSELEIALQGWGTETGDADYALRVPLASEEFAPKGYNRVFYRSAAADRLMQDGQTTVDQEKRRGIYGELQKVIWEDAPFAYLFTVDQSVAHSSRVKGVVVHPIEIVTLRGARIE